MAVLPTTNVSTTIVANALGENTHSVGNLCTSPKINMYSKYKPVRFPQEATQSYPDWWKANYVDRFAGINIASSSSPKIAFAGTWTYEKPRGNAKPSTEKIEPFRLADFRGYDHDSRPLIVNVNKDQTVDIAKSQTVRLFCTTVVNATGGGLDIMDYSGYIPDLPNCYFAAYVEGPSITPFVSTSISKLTNTTSGIEVEFKASKTGTYKVWLGISDKQILQTDRWEDKQAMFYALSPNPTFPNPVTITVKESVIVPAFVEATEIGGGYPANPRLHPIADYYVGSVGNAYFRTLDNVILKCVAVNNNNVTNNLFAADLRVYMTDWDNDYKQVPNIYLYNSNMQSVNYVSVSAHGGQTTFYIYCPNAIVPTSSSYRPSTGFRWESMIEIEVKTNIGWTVTYGYRLRLEYNSPI